MVEKSHMVDGPKSRPPQDRKAPGALHHIRRWSTKKVGLWLAGPTALLVFLNQLAAVREYVRSTLGPNSKMAAVVERLDAEVDPGKELSSLRIEAARFDEQDPNKLDIVCRNASSQPAFIRAASVELLGVWKLEPVEVSRGLLMTSANYDLTLPAVSGGSKIEKEMSQEIAAKGLDRFSLTLGPASSKEVSAKVFSFQLQLLCGEKSIPVGKFLYMTPPSSPARQPAYAANRKLIAEIRQATGVKNGVLDQFLASAPAE